MWDYDEEDIGPPEPRAVQVMAAVFGALLMLAACYGNVWG